MKNKSIIAILIPIIFSIINYCFFQVQFNYIELIMVILITNISLYFYIKTNDYLNPIIYFPILYFLLFWIGDFDFGLAYPSPSMKMWWLYLLGLVGFYCGAFFANIIKIRKSSRKENDDFISYDARILFICIFFVCIVCKFLTFYKYGIPLFSSNVDFVRETIGESTGVLKVISSAHTIISVFFFYDIINRKINKKKFMISNVILILISFTIAFLEVARLVAIQMIIPMIFIYTLKYKRIELKKILKFILFMLFFISIVKFGRNILENPRYLSYVLHNRNSNIFVNIFLSGFNSFRVAIDDLRLLINIVPSHSNYTYGKMFMNSIISVLPGKQVIIGNYVSELLKLNFNGLGAATTILGMFYLDGGPILIFVGMILFAFFVQFNYKKYIKASDINLYSLFSIYIIYYSILTLRTNVMPTIEPLLNLFYYYIFGIIAKKIKRRN